MRALQAILWIVTIAILLAISPAVRGEEVDVELVLAVDVSMSMDEKSFRLEMQGYADAFRDPQVHRAIRAGGIGRIAVTLMQWSGYGTNQISVAWFLIDGPDTAERFAAAILAAQRMPGGSTSISGAIDFGLLLFGSEHEGLRRVIDISGDGKNNDGPDPSLSRTKAIARGITINGLPIAGGENGLEDYYRDSVIGGPGAFLVVANGYEDFGRAIARKLIAEIASIPVQLAAQ
jgi:hypothetical protein